MKLMQGMLAGLILASIASTGVAQQPRSQSTPAVRPAIAFPPTPTPAPKEEPMDQEMLDAHLVPSQFLGRTSDVLALVFNGFRRSQVDPCGCVTHQLGGLAKEATLINRIHELKIPAFEVDAGGFIKDMPDEKMIVQSKYLLKGLGELGYDAVNVGFTDISIPPVELKESAKEAGVELVSANIVDAAGHPVFKPYIIKDVQLTSGSTIRVGVIGVTRPRVELTEDAATQASNVTAGLSEGSTSTLTIINPIEAINQYAAEIKDKTDFVVVLDYDRRSNAEPIIKGISANGIVDVLIMGENTQILGNVQAMDGIQVVSGGYEGRQVGTLYVELKNDKIESTWSKHIEVIQTIPSDPAIDKLIEETHDATKSSNPGSLTSPSTGPESTSPGKLNLGNP